MFPTLLIGIFLVIQTRYKLPLLIQQSQAYSFCHSNWYSSSYKQKLELLPRDLLRFEENSMRSEDSLFDGTKLSLLERPRSTDTFTPSEEQSPGEGLKDLFGTVG